MTQDKEPVAAAEAQSTLLPPAPLKPRAAVVNLEELPKTLAGPDPSASLVRSVKGLGVLQPVLVAYDGKRYKVLAGRRRIAAAREAELDKIPARVYDVEDLEAGYAELITLAENEQRSANPVAEIEALRKLVKGGASEKEIARDAGMPVARIRARLRIAAGLCEELWKGMREGKVSLPAAQAACRMPAKLQNRLAGHLAATGRLGLVEVAAIKRVRAAKAVAAIPEAAFGSPEVKDLPALTAAVGALKVALARAREIIDNPGDAAHTTTMASTIVSAAEQALETLQAARQARKSA